jgi:peptidyl-dipeptidase Dcp
MLIFAPMTNTPPAPTTDSRLFKRSDLPYALPRFDLLTPERIEPVMHNLMAAEKKAQAEIAAKPASFANTVLSFETLDLDPALVNNSLWVMFSACSSPKMRKLEARLNPLLAANAVELGQDPLLFEKLKLVHAERHTLGPQQRRVVEKHYRGMVQSGVGLADAQKAEFLALTKKLSARTTAFSNKQKAEAKAKTIFLAEADLDGLPERLRKELQEAAKQEKRPGEYAVLFNYDAVGEFLTYSTRRELRQQVWEKWSSRNNSNDAFDTNKDILQIVPLRQKLAQLLGYASHADMVTETRAAKTPKGAIEFQAAMVPDAVAAYRAEKQALEEFAKAQGHTDKIEPWDFAYYSRLHEEQAIGLTDEQLRPYLNKDNVRATMFAIAQGLGGLSFVERNLPANHPDAQVWEVFDRKKKPIGLYIADDFARSGEKEPGAWAGGIRDFDGISGELPIIFNLLSLARPEPGQSALLSLDGATTIAHEFGHALNGLLARSQLPSLSWGTMPWDVVELPSQLMERFFTHPVVMKEFLRHNETGEPMPDEMIEKVQQKLAYGRGQSTLYYLALGLIDMELYSKPDGKFDPQTFQYEVMDKYGIPREVIPRPRLQSFGHIMSGGYPAGFYGYIYSEALDADAIEPFKEDPFDTVWGERLLKHIYANGDHTDFDKSYKAFRGRAPDPQALNRRFGWDKKAALTP